MRPMRDETRPLQPDPDVLLPEAAEKRTQPRSSARVVGAHPARTQGRSRRHSSGAPGLTEHQHQAAVFSWAMLMGKSVPQLGLLYAIPNAHKRTPRQGAWMKAEGLKPGFPDVCLPVPVLRSGALYVELKRPGSGRLDDAQRSVGEQLVAAGNVVVVAWGHEQARAAILWYLGLAFSQGRIERRARPGTDWPASVCVLPSHGRADETLALLDAACRP